jgi:hypothetical protein
MLIGYIKIPFESLPEAAKAGFSEDQLSYIDEFSFYRYNNDDNDIEAWYGGKPFCLWNGKMWE